MRIAVYGLWHLGCVTAACLAEAGHKVIGLDRDADLIENLRQHRPPLHEPGLAELIAAGAAGGNLSFTTDVKEALLSAEVVWVTFDTPVDDNDQADVSFVRQQLERLAPALRPGTVVLISSQVPAGFTRRLEADWHDKGLHFAYSPENLRLGKALDVFRKPERVVLGVRDEADKPTLEVLFRPFCARLVWMSVESAEMTKHALNAFLATSVTFINELARLCEAVGADAKEVEQGLKSEGRIGPRAYLSPGAAYAGGTLARDVSFLIDFGRRHRIGTPLLSGVRSSNDLHRSWARETVERLILGIPDPVVALLGLTYKPGTSTLRRSAAVELCTGLLPQGVCIQAHDPTVTALPPELGAVGLTGTAEQALRGADVLVLATEWPEYRRLQAEQVVGLMRRPQVVDPNHFLASALATERRITYVAIGQRRVAA